MTTSTREHQNSDEKPNKRKKISSSSNGSADNATKKTIKRSMPKPKVNANVIELTDYSSLENKDLVKIAKERKIKENREIKIKNNSLMSFVIHVVIKVIESTSKQIVRS